MVKLHHPRDQASDIRIIEQQGQRIRRFLDIIPSQCSWNLDCRQSANVCVRVYGDDVMWKWIFHWIRASSRNGFAVKCISSIPVHAFRWEITRIPRNSLAKWPIWRWKSIVVCVNSVVVTRLASIPHERTSAGLNFQRFCGRTSIA